MRFLGSKYANNAFAAGVTGGAYSAPPDPIAGKGEGLRKGGPPGRRAGEGENCCHQMSDFTAKMRGRAI